MYIFKMLMGGPMYTVVSILFQKNMVGGEFKEHNYFVNISK